MSLPLKQTCLYKQLLALKIKGIGIDISGYAHQPCVNDVMNGVGQLVSSALLPSDSWKHKEQQAKALFDRRRPDGQRQEAIGITQDKCPNNAAELTELSGVPLEQQNVDPLHVEKKITENMINFTGKVYKDACNDLRRVFADMAEKDTAPILQLMCDGTIEAHEWTLAGTENEEERRKYMETKEFWTRFCENIETVWRHPEEIKRRLLLWWDKYKNVKDQHGNKLMSAIAYKAIENALKRCKHVKNIPGAAIPLGRGGPYNLMRYRKNNTQSPLEGLHNLQVDWIAADSVGMELANALLHISACTFNRLAAEKLPEDHPLRQDRIGHDAIWLVHETNQAASKIQADPPYQRMPAMPQSITEEFFVTYYESLKTEIEQPADVPRPVVEPMAAPVVSPFQLLSGMQVHLLYHRCVCMCGSTHT